MSDHSFNRKVNYEGKKKKKKKTTTNESFINRNRGKNVQLIEVLILGHNRPALIYNLSDV